MKKTVVAPEIKAAIIASDLTNKELARTYGVSVNVVAIWRRCTRHPARPRARHIRIPYNVKLAAVRSGMGARAIAEKYGAHVNTVHSWFKRYGPDARPKYNGSRLHTPKRDTYVNNRHYTNYRSLTLKEWIADRS